MQKERLIFYGPSCMVCIHMKPRWLVLKLLWLAYFSGVGFDGLDRKLTIPPEKEGRRRRDFGSCKKIQRYQVENDLVLNSIAFYLIHFRPFVIYYDFRTCQINVHFPIGRFQSLEETEFMYSSLLVLAT